MIRLGPDIDIPAFCREWATSPAMRELVSVFGGELDPRAGTADLLAWLDDFSRVWDYRALRERNELSEPELDDGTRAAVDRCVAALGLRDVEPPSRDRYDHVVILGGLARGCLARPRHAARLLQDGVVSARLVTALGGFRPVNAGERPLLEAFGLSAAEHEFDVMDLGVRGAFGLATPDEVHGVDEGDETRRWRVHRYLPAGGPPVQVVAAPAAEPGRRANTAVSCRWLAREWQTFERGESMLIVTTFHYRLFQLADAIREIGLPAGLAVDGVGMAPGDVDPRLAWEPTAGGYLQEVRSSIRALRRLYAALSEASPR